MIRKTLQRWSAPLAVAAGLITAAPPANADFFKDVERAFTGTYEDAKSGVKGVVRDADRALNKPAEPTYPATSGAANPPPYAGASLVADVQTELTKAGYNPGPADGKYGPRTADAIIAYQRNNGVPADGQATPELLKHIRMTRAAAYLRSDQPTTPTPPAPGGQTSAQQASPQQTQQSCKPYEKRTMIDGRETVTAGTACLQADGTWKPIN